MFQRIKASIDSALQEEQARARATQSSPSRAGPGARRVANRAVSPTKRDSRQTSRDRRDGPSKGPDPADFEAAFVIDDEELSRAGTPRPLPEVEEQNGSRNRSDVDAKPSEDRRGLQDNGEQSGVPTPELPGEVRVKLRKLEKLESRYQELLRSYRIAHARVQTIDVFEKSLRENTPLTSISEPKALVEYLTQVNLKGDMVLDELKRVSSERDSYKQKLEEAEQKTREAYDEAVKLRLDRPNANLSESENNDKKQSVSHDEVEGQDLDGEDDPLGATRKSPPPSIKSPTIGIPKMSLFSPKLKSLASPHSRQGSEDLFSYDSEIPRLEGELQAKQEKIESLETDVQKLTTDLSVTRESTQSMVQTLEEATREVNFMRDSRDRSEADAREQQDTLERTANRLRKDLQAAEAKLRDLDLKESPDHSDRIIELESQLQKAQSEIQELRDTVAGNETKIQELDTLKRTASDNDSQLAAAQKECEQSKSQAKSYEDDVAILRSQLAQAETRIEEYAITAKPTPGTVQKAKAPEDVTSNQAVDQTPAVQEAPTASKKSKKKKKKGGNPAAEETKESAEQVDSTEKASSSIMKESISSQATAADNLQEEINRLQSILKEKDNALNKLESKLKDQEGLREEIETLRDDLVNVGQEHVEAKDQVKALSAEKAALEETVQSLEKELAEARGAREVATAGSEQKHKDLSAQFEELKVKATSLQTDLSAAQHLASSRFKDLEGLRTRLQKAQPEIDALRGEAAEVKTAKEALAKKDIEFKRLDSRHEEIRAEVSKLRQTMNSREAEIKSLNQVNAEEASSRAAAEDSSKRAQQDVSRLEAEKRQAIESMDRISKELGRVREELATHRSRLRDTEQQFAKHRSDSAGLKEEVELKSAQYASAQSLMSSMRDQTAEMATQLKEARSRCESLDEEVAEAHRLLSERSREGETMRRLLADVEGRADAKTREMKDRMDMAIEERDRAEEEASTSARRRAREMEDLRNKYRDLEKSLKRAEEDKEELEIAQRDWRRRREDLEHQAGLSSQESEEIRRAMGDLRDALDESERQARELEKQKAELRRSVEETQHRLEKLQKSNKSMAEELGKMREGKRAAESETQSSRTSVDSPNRLGSPVPIQRSHSGARVNGANASSSGAVDYAYLKNVLLQFLEQKDKKYQVQLIPVLGMLLHFDKKDEQKWMSAITAKV